MKNEDNVGWTMEDIAHQYKLENQGWKWNKCWDRARKVYRELNAINSKSYRDTKKFFDMNTPFSFYDNRDDEFSDKYVDYDTN